MGIVGSNLTVILASRYISIEFESKVILRLIWKVFKSKIFFSITPINEQT